MEQKDQPDKPDPALNKMMIVDSIHNDVMQAIAAKDKIVYDMSPNELDELFKKIAFNIKKMVAQHSIHV